MKKFGGLLVAILVFSTFAASAADPARIAVAAEGKAPLSRVSSVAARSPYFLLFDEGGKFVEAVENPHRDAPGGAGSQAVDFLAGKGVTIIIAGAFGQKMVSAMQAGGMQYLEFKGSAVDAVKETMEK